MYRVNVLGTMKMIRAFLPALREHGYGTVLNLTSTAGLAAYEGGAGYNAAKFAQHALTDALRLEEAEHNVRVIESCARSGPHRGILAEPAGRRPGGGGEGLRRRRKAAHC